MTEHSWPRADGVMSRIMRFSIARQEPQSPTLKRLGLEGGEGGGVPDTERSWVEIHFKTEPACFETCSGSQLASVEMLRAVASRRRRGRGRPHDSRRDGRYIWAA